MGTAATKKNPEKTTSRPGKNVATYTQKGPRDRYRVEEQAGHLLRRAHQRHTALFAKHIGSSGLTPTQWAALFKLSEAGSASQKELGRLTAIDGATMQVLMQRLIQRGLVAQKRDVRDRRRTQLSLTQAGQAIVAACVFRAERITRLTLAPLKPAQQRTLIKLLRLIT